MGLFNALMLTVVLSGACPGVENLAGDDAERAGLQDRFSKIRGGMNAAEVEEILGTPDQVISDEGDPSHGIHVWRERWLGFVRATVVVKLRNDRVAIASCSSGNIKDPAAWVEEIEERPRKVSGRSGGPEIVEIPGALLSEEKPWAELSSILPKLDESWTSREAVEQETASAFDSITAANSLESILERLGTPSTSRTVYGTVTHVWDLGSTRLMFTFERETLKAKQLDTFDLEIIVKENYWRARDKRRGLTVTEYL
jgi:outer membrane protein assembly factor BamE (lipoprotein component of BamABCDE complex)